MVILILYALEDTHHLENPVPMFILVGNQKRNALLRKYYGNDLNLSSPVNADLAAHASKSDFKFNQGSGLWFELTAIGEKFRFDKEMSHGIEDVMRAIHVGVDAELVPALDAKQLLAFWSLRENDFQDQAFDYAETRYLE